MSSRNNPVLGLITLCATCQFTPNFYRLRNFEIAICKLISYLNLPWLWVYIHIHIHKSRPANSKLPGWQIAQHRQRDPSQDMATKTKLLLLFIRYTSRDLWRQNQALVFGSISVYSVIGMAQHKNNNLPSFAWYADVSMMSIHRNLKHIHTVMQY